MAFNFLLIKRGAGKGSLKPRCCALLHLNACLCHARWWLFTQTTLCHDRTTTRCFWLLFYLLACFLCHSGRKGLVKFLGLIAWLLPLLTSGADANRAGISMCVLLKGEGKLCFSPAVPVCLICSADQEMMGPFAVVLISFKKEKQKRLVSRFNRAER